MGAPAPEPLSDEWVSLLAEASKPLTAGSYSGVVAVTIGKKNQAVLKIDSGRVVGSAEDDAAAVTVPVSSEQLASFVDGSVSPAVAYMKGDLKPVGSTGALLAFMELFENPQFRGNLVAE